MIATTNAKAIIEITNRVLGITPALFLYRLVQILLFPFTVLYLAVRLFTTRGYTSRFGERLGFVSQRFRGTKPGCIWLHAVSAGEIASAIPLIEELQTAEPLTPIYLSTSTIAGREAAERRASSLVNGIFFCPLDYASCVRRTLRAIRPALLVILETEIWPNLYAETKRSGARLAIVNGRISDRAWPRYKALGAFFAPILQLADAVYVQSAADYDRYHQLGVPAARLDVPGNLKYDASFSSAPADIPTFGAEQIWVAASTAGPNESGSIMRHSIDEDEIVIRSFQMLAGDFPRLLLILVPRQPARFDVVARKLESSGVRFLRRTSMESDSWVTLELPGVLLLDTVGELAGAFPLAHVVFVGGSIAPRGGHNILEPAAAGVPIVVGPHMENFEAIARDFLDSRAIVQIQHQDELLTTIRHLFTDRAAAEDLGRRACQVVERHAGVSRRIAYHLRGLQHAAFLKPVRGVLARSILCPLALLWRTIAVLNRRRSEQHAAFLPRLPVPVVSIGGLTVGGSGKTPLTGYLAARLSARGHFPAILTRGYRRRSPAQNLLLAPSTKVPPSLTGDEAQILLRAGIAPLGIGTNRYETAKILLAQFPTTDLLLLDDGFQHARMRRDVDVVVLDGLDPFGQEEIVPLGRLREPLQVLRRAHAFVVTRVEAGPRYEAICARLREYNSTAPIFRTRLLARHWCDYGTGECNQTLPARRVAAFCGLGNPQNFWNTLESLGLEIVFRWTFDDHHQYKHVELQRIAHQARVHGAEILVTTEKDRLNCPSHLDRAIAPLDLAWLEIDLAIDDELAFFAFLEGELQRNPITEAS
jgi:3-deoxy-D-manno-octulosonic-acid transferase